MKIKSILVASVLTVALGAGAHADDLNIGVGASITSIDPHYYNASSNNNIAMQILDVMRNSPDLRADVYRAASEHQLRLALR